MSFQITRGVLVKFKPRRGETQAVIPNGVKIIDAAAFSKCTAIREVILPAGVLQIGAGAFENCVLLRSIQIPDSVQIIHGFAFEDCRSLRELELPESMTEIQYAAFRSCRLLRRIRFPANLTAVGEKVFAGCTAIETLEFPAPLSPESPLFACLAEHCTAQENRVCEELCRCGAMTPALLEAALTAANEAGNTARIALLLEYKAAHFGFSGEIGPL